MLVHENVQGKRLDKAAVPRVITAGIFLTVCDLYGSSQLKVSPKSFRISRIFLLLSASKHSVIHVDTFMAQTRRSRTSMYSINIIYYRYHNIH